MGETIRRYPFERDGPVRVEVIDHGKARGKPVLTVTVDSLRVAEIATEKELRAGRDIPLGDGSVLTIRRVVPTLPPPELHVLRNGRYLPGSEGAPKVRLINACGLVHLVGGLNIVLGFVVQIFAVPFLMQLGIGFFSMVFGAVLLILGFSALRGSAPALVAAVVVFGLDGVFALFVAIDQGLAPPTGAVIARLFILMQMARGIPAIRELTRQSTKGI